MTDSTAQIADKVRGVMAEKRASQQDVADLLGLSRQAVNSRLRYRAPWLAGELYRLSAAWNVPVTRFFPDREVAA